MTYARPTLPRDTADELERVWAARDAAERGRLDGRGPAENIDILRFARSEFNKRRDVVELGGVDVGPPLPLEVAPASVAVRSVLLRRAGVEVRLRGAGSRRCFYFPQVRRLLRLSQGTRQEWDRLPLPASDLFCKNRCSCLTPCSPRPRPLRHVLSGKGGRRPSRARGPSCRRR